MSLTPPPTKDKNGKLNFHYYWYDFSDIVIVLNSKQDAVSNKTFIESADANRIK